MALPQPTENEEKYEFFNRCMVNGKMKKAYPDIGQRYKVCKSNWERRLK